jgi:hypothetical protein
MSVPITNGQGQSSIAAELIGTDKYQQIKVVGGELGSTSVMGVNPDRSISVSVIGTPTVTAIVTGSVVALTTGNQSVSGAVTAPAGSIMAVAVTGTSSVIVVPQFSSVITVWQSSSVLAVPVGSVITVWQAPSIVGTYAEDDGASSADKGMFVLGVRNDTLTTNTSADADYGAVALGPSGEVVTANAPITKWVRGTADLRVVLGASVTAIAAQGASVFTYITGVQVANMGSASVLVTLAGGLGSILGYTIAPAGGGSNILYPNALKTGENSAFTASISGTASVLVSAQGFISKT